MERDAIEERTATEPLLPSRRPALETLRSAVSAGRGPVLLTGEPGSGKTWLVSRLRSELGRKGTDAPRWLAVDLAPSTTPADLLRAVCQGVGQVVEGDPTADNLRLGLADYLAERSADRRRWALIVDESHLATTDVLEELRVLSNRLGQLDGFAALVLIGQTSLARRLGTRPLAALESRLAGRAHLGPIDADEAALLLGSEIAGAEVDRRHRDAAGNPGRLLRHDRPSQPTGPLRPVHVETSHPTVAEPRIEVASASPLVPAKPPLRVEEGLIEVGWDAEPDLAAMAREDKPAAAPAPTDESIDDPYAALQAWNEWSSGPGRLAAAGEGMDSTLRDNPNLRAEGQEDFAPYSQLFSRKRPAPSED